MTSKIGQDNEPNHETHTRIFHDRFFEFVYSFQILENKANIFLFKMVLPIQKRTKNFFTE